MDWCQFCKHKHFITLAISAQMLFIHRQLIYSFIAQNSCQLHCRLKMHDSILLAWPANTTCTDRGSSCANCKTKPAVYMPLIKSLLHIRTKILNLCQFPKPLGRTVWVPMATALLAFLQYLDCSYLQYMTQFNCLLKCEVMRRAESIQQNIWESKTKCTPIAAFWGYPFTDQSYNVTEVPTGGGLMASEIFTPEMMYSSVINNFEYHLPILLRTVSCSGR